MLDVVVHAVSERMLRYDLAGEFDFDDDFGWLDITHGLTYANAARWHVAHAPAGVTPDLLRLVLFTAFLAQWTGRHEWHTGIGVPEEMAPLAGPRRPTARSCSISRCSTGRRPSSCTPTR